MDYKDVLRAYFHYESFRGIQEDIIKSILSGKDTLGLMPTGGGKSITFQVPALAMEGLCLVITPLVALMKDQVERLRSLDILAQMIHSAMSQSQIETVLKNCIYGPYKFLYISPERLTSETFLHFLPHLKVNMIAVDESHCISQWGYDFRPSYLRIRDLRSHLPGVPVLALTATATPETIQDIQRQLGFKEENVFSMSFERKNLIYVVRKTTDRLSEMTRILSRVQGSAIVYCRSRQRTVEIQRHLTKEAGITALAYHAGMDPLMRSDHQERWQKDEVRVMVATSAFGMGIDKPDVRLVIHYDMPDSIEAYFQEAGRGGRDREKAYAVLLYDKSIRSTVLRRATDLFPTKDRIREIYTSIQYYLQMPMGEGMGTRHIFDLDTFCTNFKYFPLQVESALRILSQAGYLGYEPSQATSSRLMFTVSKEALYHLRQSEADETLIRLILRSYAGVFSQYVPISEEVLARGMEMSRQDIYERLSFLSRSRIIHYIPSSRQAHISYPMPRVDGQQIAIGEDVFEKRRGILEKKIQAMIDYAESDTECRSRQLLGYFGEDHALSCQRCDVCQSQKHA